MYRVYYGPFLKARYSTPVEAGDHAKLLLLTRGRGLPIRVYSPRGCSIKYGNKS